MFLCSANVVANEIIQWKWTGTATKVTANSNSQNQHQLMRALFNLWWKKIIMKQYMYRENFLIKSSNSRHNTIHMDWLWLTDGCSVDVLPFLIQYFGSFQKWLKMGNYMPYACSVPKFLIKNNNIFSFRHVLLHGKFIYKYNLFFSSLLFSVSHRLNWRKV